MERVNPTQTRLKALERERAVLEARQVAERKAAELERAQLDVAKREVDELGEFLRADQERQREVARDFYERARADFAEFDDVIELARQLERDIERRRDRERVRRGQAVLDEQRAPTMARLQVLRGKRSWKIITPRESLELDRIEALAEKHHW
jgi:hypothetical protein